MIATYFEYSDEQGCFHYNMHKYPSLNSSYKILEKDFDTKIDEYFCNFADCANHYVNKATGEWIKFSDMKLLWCLYKKAYQNEDFRQEANTLVDCYLKYDMPGNRFLVEWVRLLAKSLAKSSK